MMLVALAALSGTAAGADPVAPHRWRDRVLVVAAEAGDPWLAAQRRNVESARPGVRERDLVVVEAIGPAGTPLRRQLGLPEQGFRAVLVGKDGGVKLTASEPIAAEKLFATIDAMPMRREEAARGKRR